MTRKTTRRKFLATTATVAGSIAGITAFNRSSTSTAKNASSATATMPERALGNTGVPMPIFGLGGAGQTPLSSRGTEKESIALIERAWELGIRYFDTAADYGPSEGYFGKVLPDYRKQVFLASKTAKRNRDGAWRELERSLQRLNTDYLDLWQLHHVSFEEELNTIFGKNGAAKALEEAKEQKLIRFTGITGHHEPNIIAQGLRRYPFDATLIPINAADKHHPRPFIPSVLPVAQEKGVAVIAMKVPAYGRLLKPGVLEGMHQALGYTLSQAGVHCAVTAAETPAQLESNVKLARAFQPFPNSTLEEIEQRTADVWKDITFYRDWT
ncbi:MAG: aldo/keto reductase [Cyanobacteria bacterium QH_8_48_120]|jgi:aryl-alcohol dehydrogenase-like predicted oxidoreductase|nr:MAG: aldo/keto reductase [Cyanobacteria bacterium QH_1_48_107]PSO58948.1 MAG: aldo/keto reductase [Cyanobacteria bacterium QH_10_48_56]PSO63496.1 MAG: aldo/keto reductase [Cyanobacteria bacterium QH_7_48_89]PSO66939.1 MAG: aldo/keto reductase [Cyanobacteria bacterium QH_6_48_35]PSO71675.1 MAG: aldo/keto reductase [Cyanobacteria bacterium QH_8_48_120]PSO72660.1 MAG: aldo/keto reductase [Cyanobacteria bacterium QH_3_48_40]PSO81706.1 MAG: aldo/keto reductase [Cyanobacteria bacterium QS_5_48_6